MWQANGTAHSELPAGQVPDATCVQFVPKRDGYCLLVGLETGELSLWSLHTGEQPSWAKLL